MKTNQAETLKIICLIPARGGSKRLPNKNLYPLFGKSLLQWAIEGCLESRYLNYENIYVSSEDSEIQEVASKIGVNVIPRPNYLSQDHIWTQDVLIHASDYLEEHGINYDLMVRVQANSPQIKGDKIDESIEKLKDYKLWEIFSVNGDGIEDAAIHVLLRQCVYQKALSVYKGVVSTNYIDVHTEKDINEIKMLWGQ